MVKRKNEKRQTDDDDDDDDDENQIGEMKVARDYQFSNEHHLTKNH